MVLYVFAPTGVASAFPLVGALMPLSGRVGGVFSFGRENFVFFSVSGVYNICHSCIFDVYICSAVMYVL